MESNVCVFGLWVNRESISFNGKILFWRMKFDVYLEIMRVMISFPDIEFTVVSLFLALLTFVHLSVAYMDLSSL